MKHEQLLKVQSATFLGIETSPQNYQVWVAVSAEDGVNTRDIIRALCRGTEADATASGATRLAGSWNFKEKYAPNYPVVSITYNNPERIVTVQELEAMQILKTPSRMMPKPIIHHEWNRF